MRGLIADRRGIYIVLLFALFVSAACGSTVQAPEQATQITGDELGGGISADDVLPPGATINKKGQVVSASGEVLGTAEEFGLDVPGSDSGGAGTTAGGTTGGVGGGGGGGSAAALGPGVTDDKIYLGIIWINAGAANQGLAGQSLESDSRKAYNAMIEEVNKAGGLGGREVVPINHEFNGSSSETIAQQAQAACARFTQD